MKSNKQKVLDFIVENVHRFNWVQDKNSHYTDFEAKLKCGITLRVVSAEEGAYLQILKSWSDYQYYNASEYRDVEKILDAIFGIEKCKKEEKFFDYVHEKLIKEF